MKTIKSNSLTFKKLATAVMGFVCLVQLPSAMSDNLAVYESRYDHYRTGANLKETILNTSNVNHSQFGLLYTLPVSGTINAQPLYVPNVPINGSIYNTIYVLTSTGMLYAFDADKIGVPLWVTNINSASRPIHTTWVTKGTPIIDPNSNTLYFVSELNYWYKTLTRTEAIALHAVDITTGAEKTGSPVTLSGTFTAGTTQVTFDPSFISARPGLALAKGQVVIAMGALNEGDMSRYHGWVFSYDAKTLAQSGIFTPSPNTFAGGIWAGGRAPAVDDSGFVYYNIGNSYSLPKHPAYDGAYNFSESVVKLDPSNGLKIVDWFTPADWKTRDSYDLDLGSSGPMIIPGTNLLTTGGKYSTLYLLNNTNLGKYSANDANAVQSFKLNSAYTEITSGPALWQRSSSNGGSMMYIQSSDSVMNAYNFNGSKYTSSTPIAQSATIAPDPGASITVSANGDTSGTGIVWTMSLLNSTDNTAVLRALNAENITQELWNSQNYLSDNIGNYQHFDVAIVTNGKVFAPTASNQVSVYGLLNTVAPPTLSVIANQTSATGATVNLAVTATDPNKNTLTYSASNLPTGLSINANTGAITGKLSQIGTYAASVSVSNGKTAPKIANFTWTVSAGAATTTSHILPMVKH